MWLKLAKLNNNLIFFKYLQNYKLNKTLGINSNVLEIKHKTSSELLTLIDLLPPSNGT